jgi:hypothetical protein
MISSRHATESSALGLISVAPYGVWSLPRYANAWSTLTIPMHELERSDARPLVVPKNEIRSNTIFGAVLVRSVPRTQGLEVDQHRVILLRLACGLSDVRPEPERVRSSKRIQSLASAIDQTRRHSGLPVAELARVSGLQRRQLYNILDGGSTSREREQRIRAFADVVERLFAREASVASVRSLLLAPIASDLASFVDLVAGGEPIPEAWKRLEASLTQRGRQVRQYLQTPRVAREHQSDAAATIRATRDIAPDGG